MTPRSEEDLAIPMEDEILVEVLTPGGCSCGQFVWPKRDIYLLQKFNENNIGYVFTWDEEVPISGRLQ